MNGGIKSLLLVTTSNTMMWTMCLVFFKNGRSCLVGIGLANVYSGSLPSDPGRNFSCLRKSKARLVERGA